MRVRYLGRTTQSCLSRKMLRPFRTVQLKPRNAMCSQRDSHAKTSATAGRRQELEEKSQACSMKPFAWLDSSDPQGSCWKTYQRSLLDEGWMSFSNHFANSGMMLNGKLYPANPLVDLTSEQEPSLWPTPAAHEARLGYQKRHAGAKGTQESLTTVVINRLGGREAVTGQLNPQFVSWLMGFPQEHINCDASETQ